MIKICSKIINPISFEKLEILNPGTLIIENGKIKDLTEKLPEKDFLDYTNYLILPGFVDIHTHLSQINITGKGEEDLIIWLNKIVYPEEGKFEAENYAKSMAEKFFDKLIENGITTAVIYVTSHYKATEVAFEIAQQKGLRAFIGKVMMDTNCLQSVKKSTKENLEESLKLYQKWHAKDDRLFYIFTLRFAPVCSIELMKETGRIAKELNCYIQTHLAESKKEIELVKKLFPEYKSYTHLYHKCGITGEKTIFAHCIHLSDEEMEILKDTNSKIAHCPYSNRFLKSGKFRYKKFKDLGIKIGLGSDIAGGPSLSPFRQISEAILTSRDLKEELNYEMTIEEALYLATMGGAEVLNLQEKIGNFKKGKEADFIVIETEEKDPQRALEKLIFCDEKWKIKEVWIKGKKIYP